MNLFYRTLILICAFFLGSTPLYASAPVCMWSDATHNSISLGWNDSDDETAYNIYEKDNPAPLATLSQDTTSYVVTDLNPTTTYYFTITAIIGGVESAHSAVTESATTHVWNEGPFRECINGWIGNSPSAIPTRNQLESLDSSRMIFCEGRNISDISPIGDLKNIMAISLKNNLLTMESIAPMSSLTQLGTIILADNNLSGPVPSWLAEMGNLSHLDLSNTHLSGSIPSWIVDLPLMSTLKLFGNDLTGPIPTDIGNWTNLYALYLADNDLSGVIPTQIGTLTGLTYLELENNNLTGPIPPGIADTALYSLNLSNNALTGSIPSAIGDLENLTWLDLGHNQLTGPIPTSLGSIYPNLIDLSDNKLTGAIPSELGNNINSLRQLFLSDNYLSGEIPFSFASFQSIYNKGDLSLDNNCDLFTENAYLRSFLDAKTWTGYQGIIDTNGNCYCLEGDINADGFVNVSDLILVLQIVAGMQPSPEIEVNADVNGNNRIDIAEALYIIRTLGAQ